MRVVVSEFTSLDGVVQAPGGPEEDTSGGFGHGGWSLAYFDPDTMGPVIGEIAERIDALLQGRRTYQVSSAAWPGRAASGGCAGEPSTRSLLIRGPFPSREGVPDVAQAYALASGHRESAACAGHW